MTREERGGDRLGGHSVPLAKVVTKTWREGRDHSQVSPLWLPSSESDLIKVCVAQRSSSGSTRNRVLNCADPATCD